MCVCVCYRMRMSERDEDACVIYCNVKKDDMKVLEPNEFNRKEMRMLGTNPWGFVEMGSGVGWTFTELRKGTWSFRLALLTQQALAMHPQQARDHAWCRPIRPSWTSPPLLNL